MIDIRKKSLYDLPKVLKILMNISVSLISFATFPCTSSIVSKTYKKERKY